LNYKTKQKKWKFKVLLLSLIAFGDPLMAFQHERVTVIY